VPGGFRVCPEGRIPFRLMERTRGA
jgi:hypothetical protein